MLEDSAAEVVITHPAAAGRIPPHGARVVCVEGDADAIAVHPSDDPAPLATADTLAYVIYTSGSTGRPKGAMNQHGAVLNRVLWMQEAYGLTSDDAVLQKTPYSFDVSVWEFLWPLAVGARL